LLWQKDTDSLQDSILAYSEMPGGLDDTALKTLRRDIPTEEQFDKLRK